MSIEQLIQDKSQKLLRLQQLVQAEKAEPKKVRELAEEVASLEGEIARRLIEMGQIEKAVVNLVSQASCLVDAGRTDEAVRVIRECLRYVPRHASPSGSLRNFKTCIASLITVQWPGRTARNTCLR